MSKRLSELYGLRIYTDKAEYVGIVEDLTLNAESGEITWLSLKSFKNPLLINDEIKKILQEESIPYTDIVQAGDIVICKKNPKRTGKNQKKS